MPAFISLETALGMASDAGITWEPSDAQIALSILGDEVRTLRTQVSRLESDNAAMVRHLDALEDPEVADDEVVHLRARVAAMENELGESREMHSSAERFWHDVSTGLRPLCPCGSNPATYDGPQRECVLHGDGDTFVAYVRALESVAKTAAWHAADLENGERIVLMLHALDALDGVS